MDFFDVLKGVLREKIKRDFEGKRPYNGFLEWRIGRHFMRVLGESLRKAVAEEPSKWWPMGGEQAKYRKGQLPSMFGIPVVIIEGYGIELAEKGPSPYVLLRDLAPALEENRVG